MLTRTENIIGVVMALKERKAGFQQPTLQLSILRTYFMNVGKQNIGSKPIEQIERGGCNHCGNGKHTHETWFKLHGYLEWWNEHKAQKQQEAQNSVVRVALVIQNLNYISFMELDPQMSMLLLHTKVMYTMK